MPTQVQEEGLGSILGGGGGGGIWTVLYFLGGGGGGEVRLFTPWGRGEVVRNHGEGWGGGGGGG